MGDFLSGALGLKSSFQQTAAQPGNPYDQSYLQQGVNQQNQIYQQQQALAQMLQAQAAGRGPNPAQVQLQQNTQQNNQNAQGLIASQRGLNPALATRMGANAATNANQQAASQSALMQQLQQMQAQNSLAGLYGQLQQGNLAQQQLYVNPNTAAMQTNAAVAAGDQQASTKVVGGLLSGLSSAAGTAAKAAYGGEVVAYADGGEVKGPQSSAGKFLAGMNTGFNDTTVDDPLTAGFGAVGKTVNRMESGGTVPGNATVRGDSYANDKIPAMLSPKEIVLPRSVTMSKDPAGEAAKFVAAIMAKKGRR